MRNLVACLLGCLLLAVLGGCGPKGFEKRVIQECQSMAPLRQVIPIAKEINGVPIWFMGCPNHTEIVAEYGASRKRDQSYYAYTIRVLDGASPYVSSFLHDPENMIGGEDQFVVGLEMTAASFLETKVDYCREKATNYKNRPRAVLKEVGGLEFCIYRDGGRQPLELWYAIAVHDDLLLTVMVWEPQTVEQDFPENVMDRMVLAIEHLRLDALK
jgi:hypothetical protein